MLLTLSVIAFIILFISFCIEVIFKFQTYDVYKIFKLEKFPRNILLKAGNNDTKTIAVM